MPSQSSFVFKLTFSYIAFGSICNNVFWYRGASITSPNPALTLATQFNTVVKPAIQDLLADSVQLRQIDCEDVTSLSNIASISLTGQTGARPGEALANNICSSFRYDRASRDTRNGWKRIGPCTENNVNGNSFEVGFATIAINSANTFETVLSSGTDVYVPIIARAPDTFPAASVTYSDIIGVSFIDRVTSQNSRKAF